MTIDDIKALIAAGESRTLELKKSTGELKDGMHAACAFLNTDGGWLIFGVTPKSLKIVGQQVTDDTKREISQALAGIEPAYHIKHIVPVRALREALINALCHRQWEKQNLTISIAVYDDRVEIANPGVFPPQIPIENIKDSHESYPYNRNMAQALYRSTFLESWGSGIHRIIEACREQGLEDPSWRWDGGFVYVTFKRPSYGGSGTIESTIKNSGNTQEGDESTQETANGTQESTQENRISTQDKILNILRENPTLTTSEVASKLGTTRDGIRKVLEKLKADGRLTREGSTKAGRWIVNENS